MNMGVVVQGGFFIHAPMQYDTNPGIDMIPLSPGPEYHCFEKIYRCQNYHRE